MKRDIPENSLAEIEEYNEKVRKIEEKKGQVAPIARGLLAISSKRNYFVASNIDDMTNISKSTVYVAIKVAESMNIIVHAEDNEDTYGRNANIYYPINPIGSEWS